VNLVSALVPSDMACLARPLSRIRHSGLDLHRGAQGAAQQQAATQDVGTMPRQQHAGGKEEY
jgi:hypothetical protein